MVKIERVISDCSECIFSKEFQEKNGNTDFVLICTYGSEVDPSLGFMIKRHHDKIKEYVSVEIPEQCPLEDYVPKKLKDNTPNP